MTADLARLDRELDELAADQLAVARGLLVAREWAGRSLSSVDEALEAITAGETFTAPGVSSRAPVSVAVPSIAPPSVVPPAPPANVAPPAYEESDDGLITSPAPASMRPAASSVAPPAPSVRPLSMPPPLPSVQPPALSSIAPPAPVPAEAFSVDIGLDIGLDEEGDDDALIEFDDLEIIEDDELLVVD